MHKHLQYGVQVSHKPQEVVLISLNSQMWKPSLREVKQFASGHTAPEWSGRLGSEMGFKLTSDPKLLLSTKVLSRGTRSVSLAAGGSWSLGLCWGSA